MRKSTRRLVGILAVAAVLAGGCGRYFTAEIAGYVTDEESDAGINGAVIRMYLEEPEAPDAPGFVVKTASMTSGGNAGYFSHKIIWQNIFPQFGAEGDSGTIWIGVTHEDYTSAVAQVEGILSDTVNVVPDTELARASFEVPEVTGTVVLASTSEPVNGVRLILDLASTEDETDYITTTTTIDDEEGTYRFQNVRWRDDSPDSASTDTETATIRVADGEYSWEQADGTDGLLSVTLTSDQPTEVSDPIDVTSTRFSVPDVTGRVIRQGTGEPLNGVRVVLDLSSTDDEDTDYVTTTRTIDDEDGTYRFDDVTWEDEDPDDPAYDTESAVVRVDDDVYEWVDEGNPRELAVSLRSEQPANVPDVIPVSRQARSEFSTRLVGACVRRVTDNNGVVTEYPLRGVEVTVTYIDDDGESTLVQQTGPDGEFAFFLSWTDETPRDYDSGTDESIPEGEDGILVDVAYSLAGETFETPAGQSVSDLPVKSWLEPNYLPDAVVAVP